MVVYEHDDVTAMPKPDTVLHHGDVAMVCIDRLSLLDFNEIIRS